MLEKAEKKLQGKLSSPIIQADALRMPFADNSFDITSIAFGVRNFVNLESGLREIFRVLKPGGSILVLEFGQPNGLFFSPLYRVYSKIFMPLIGGFISGNKKAYQYLPETAGVFPCGSKFNEILQSCGFRNPESKRLSGGIAYCYKAVK